MEKVFRSVALIRKYEGGKPDWLVIWDNANQWWDFIVGERLEKESFRETVIREVSWRLNLERNEFLVSNMSQLNMEYVGQLPGQLEERHIAVAFYAVDLYKSSVARRLADSKTKTAWLDSSEVCAGQQSKNGPLLNPLICHWINRWQIVLPWQ